MLYLSSEGLDLFYCKLTLQQTDEAYTRTPSPTVCYFPNSRQYTTTTIYSILKLYRLRGEFTSKEFNVTWKKLECQVETTVNLLTVLKFARINHLESLYLSCPAHFFSPLPSLTHSQPKEVQLFTAIS